MKKLPLLASTLLAATALATPAFADDLTWNGSSDSWTGTDAWNDDSTGDPATFTEGDNVTFTATGAGAITLGEAIEAGSIDIRGSGSYTISNGEGTSLSASSLTVETDQGVTTTIDVSTLTIEGALSIKPVSSDSSNTHRVLVIGDGSNATVATAGSLYMQGSSELQVSKGSTVTVTTVTDSGGYDETISGEGTFIAETVTHSINHDFVVSIANFQATNFTLSANTARATFSGGASTVGTLTLGTSGASVTYTGEGNHTVGELLVHTNQTATLDYSGLTGGLIITKLDFGNSAALTINGNDKGTITELSFTNTGVTLAVNGTVNVGTMNITTNNDTPTINIAENATLNVTTMNVYPGGFGSGYYTKVNGVSADTSTFITGSLTIGSGTTGAGLEVKNATFITGGITFSHEAGNGYFYLYLDDVTLGFTQSTTIEAGGGISSYIELGDHGSGSGFDTTDTPSTTVINTNQYNTTDGAFTSTGLTITIEEMIAGTGTLEVTGNGTLTLSGANTYSGGTTITSGTVVANNATALGSGDVTVKGGQLSVSTGIEISNTISITLTEAYFEIYALTGEGAIADGATIEITVDSAVAALLADGGEYTFDIYDSQLSGLSSTNFDTTALEEYGTVSWDQGVLTIVSDVPEPSMFGLFFGLGAIGLVATRRRRKVA